MLFIFYKKLYYIEYRERDLMRGSNWCRVPTGVGFQLVSGSNWCRITLNHSEFSGVLKLIFHLIIDLEAPFGSSVKWV